MKFFMSATAFVALVNTAFAQVAGFNAIIKPSAGEKLNAGSSYVVEWIPSPEYDDKNVNLYLMYGTDPAHLVVQDAPFGVARSADGKFSWTVDSKLGADNTYGIKLTLAYNEEIFQYSFPFHIVAADYTDVPESTDAPAKPTDVTPPVVTLLTNGTIPQGTISSWSTVYTQPPSSNGTVTYNPGVPTNLPTKNIPDEQGLPTSVPTPPVVAGAASLGSGVFAVVAGLAAAVLAF